MVCLHYSFVLFIMTQIQKKHNLSHIVLFNFECMVIIFPNILSHHGETSTSLCGLVQTHTNHQQKGKHKHTLDPYEI